MADERDALIETLQERRQFLRHTLAGLSDEQAGTRSTASVLCVGGLVKHVADVEEAWSAFMVGGSDAMNAAASHQNYEAAFRMEPDDTVESVLARYDDVAARTDERIRSIPDLGVSYPLPDQPWFPPNSSWSARRAVLHMIGETAHHSGHADIIRETIDGAKTMG
jgi:uncharacterized damage-inducible protein DinB